MVVNKNEIYTVKVVNLALEPIAKAIQSEAMEDTLIILYCRNLTTLFFYKI